MPVSAEQSIVVQPPAAPLISLLYTTGATSNLNISNSKSNAVLNSGLKVNPAQSLKLLAVISLNPSYSLQNCTCEWSTDDSSYTTSTISSSPAVIILPHYIAPVSGASNSSLSYKSFFSVNAGVVAPGASLSFILSCRYQQKFVSSATLQLLFNSPPTPGSFIVSPTDGVAVSTVFQLTSMNWADADLPLKYAFGFLSSSSNDYIQSMSEKSMTDTVLIVSQLSTRVLLSHL